MFLVRMGNRYSLNLGNSFGWEKNVVYHNSLMWFTAKSVIDEFIF